MSNTIGDAKTTAPQFSKPNPIQKVKSSEQKTDYSTFVQHMKDHLPGAMLVCPFCREPASRIMEGPKRPEGQK